MLLQMENLKETSRFVPDQDYLPRVNFYIPEIIERYTPISPNALRYEVVIEDPNVFTRAWTMSMPLYRRLDENVQLLEFKCVEFVEELMYGHLRKDPVR